MFPNNINFAMNYYYELSKRAQQSFNYRYTLIANIILYQIASIPIVDGIV